MYGLAYRPIWNFNSSTFWNNSKLETAQIPMNSMNMLWKINTHTHAHTHTMEYCAAIKNVPSVTLHNKMDKSCKCNVQRTKNKMSSFRWTKETNEAYLCCEKSGLGYLWQGSITEKEPQGVFLESYWCSLLTWMLVIQMSSVVNINQKYT